MKFICEKCGKASEVNMPLLVDKKYICYDCWEKTGPNIGPDNYMHLPISNLVFRIASSVDRLFDFVRLKAPIHFIRKEIKIFRRYRTVIIARFDEFTSFIRKFRFDKQLSDDELKRDLPFVCLALLKTWEKEWDKNKGKNRKNKRR